MSSSTELSLLLARRQKRLIYWKHRFQAESLSSEQASQCEDLFSTFSLLLTKILRAKDAQEREDCEARMESIERELSNLFSSRRLMTSDLGNAITDEPEAGDAGH